MKQSIEPRTMHLILDEKRRCIFISDIHGNYDLFMKLLEKVQYSEEDYLFLLGDIIEKGQDNLKTLEYVMELAKKERVFALLGNCDDIYERDIVHIRDEKLLLRYALVKGNSVINEMAERLQIKITKESNLQQICAEFVRHFQPHIQYLANLPHIIETPYFTLVHAGLLKETGDNRFDVMHQVRFLEKANSYPKWVIVGHYPTINYCHQTPSFNPIIEQQKHIVSIDGGNRVNRYGQLNALIIEDFHQMDFRFTYVDSFPVVRTKVAQDIPQSKTTNLVWQENQIQILEKKEHSYRCLHLATKKEYDILEADLFTHDGHLCTNFASDYWLKVEAGVEVSLLGEYEDKILAKYQGIVGFIQKSYLE